MTNLPKDVTINHDTDGFNFDTLDEIICDYLSDKYGFCIYNYGYELNIKVTDIEWDVTD